MRFQRYLCDLVAFVVALVFLTLPTPAAATDDALPLLPAPVDSFGAAVHEGWIYLYGGHRGPRHEQTGKNLSRFFVRCRLNGGAESWEQLATDKPLENLPLVSCGKHLYRVGGTGLADSKSPAGSVKSVADFARFDPSTNKWMSLPPLPSPRSSHDSIAVDEMIYVVGGWDHHDQKINDWHDSALVYDTSLGDKGTWQSLPVPSFRRRGLALATWQNCVWAVGGKDDDDVIHRTVFCYDPQRGYWSEGPELPARADGLQGYGVAAWGLESGLYVCGADGMLYRLSSMYGEWETVGEMRVQRYCHRLLPEGKTSLLAIGGSSVSFGQTGTTERIKVYSP